MRRSARARGSVYSFEVPLAIRAASLVLAASLVASMACSSSSNDTCTCLVEQNSERRTLVCGEASCVGGTIVTCTDQNKIAQRGSCVETPGSSEPPTPSPDSGNGTPPDPSCDDLRTFCATNCSNPASLSSDCQTTASNGDPQACAAWQLTNGVLCMP